MPSKRKRQWRKPLVFDYIPKQLRPRLSHPRRTGYRDALMRLLLTEIECGSSLTRLYGVLLAKALLAAPYHADRRFSHVVDERYRDELEEVLRREGLAAPTGEEEEARG
jgi:hypothetical protein